MFLEWGNMHFKYSLINLKRLRLRLSIFWCRLNLYLSQRCVDFHNDRFGALILFFLYLSCFIIRNHFIFVIIWLIRVTAQRDRLWLFYALCAIDWLLQWFGFRFIYNIISDLLFCPKLNLFLNNFFLFCNLIIESILFFLKLVEISFA